MELLLEKGVDHNVKGTNGETPLHHAAQHGSKEVAQLLLEKKADPDMKGTEETFAFSSKHGSMNIAELLLEKGFLSQ